MPKTTEELYQELLAQGNQYQQQANDILGQYDDRGAFSYNPNNDASYQALKNLYVNQGRRAMQDTMGQAAGLTGGYGSSYSQSVGNQAYNEYLTKLNAEIPGLAQQARAAWDAEGDRLLNRYNLALNAANTAYGQGRDALGDLRYEQEWAQKQQEYADDLAYRDWQKQQAEASAASDQAYREWQMSRSDQSDARDIAMMMIQMGQMPNAELLAKAGLSASDAQIMARYYAQQAALAAAGSSSGSGSGSRSSGTRSTGGSGSGSGSGTGGGGGTQYTTQEVNDAYKAAKQAILMTGQTGNINYAVDALDRYADMLTPEMAAELMDMLDRIRANIEKPGQTSSKNYNSNGASGGGGKWLDMER